MDPIRADVTKRRCQTQGGGQSWKPGFPNSEPGAPCRNPSELFNLAAALAYSPAQQEGN